jgi:hypothetical protein
MRDVQRGRLAGILILAALIVAAGTLFGNEFASEEMHEDAAAETEHSEPGEEAEHDEAAEEADDTGAGQVAGAVLLSIGAVVLVPLAAPLARRREDDAELEVPAEPDAGLAGLRAELALLSVGAAVIHFAVIAEHLDEWWLTGTFFIVVALFQLAWAVAVLAWPSRLVYAVGAVVNALVVITWIVSRTTGVPVGPEAGEPEAVGFPDLLATGFEVLLVAIAAGLVLEQPAAMRILGTIGQTVVTWITAVAVVALTALSLALLP